MVVGWSLWGFEASTHNITQTQPYQKSTPHCKRHISIRVHPYAHPQHSRCSNTLYIYDMVRGCSLWGVGALAMTLQHHSDSAIAHIFQKSTPHLQRYQCNSAPTICPSTASQGAKTLCIYMPWLGDVVSGVWSLNHDLTTTLGLSHAPIFQKSTASQRAKTLFISNMDVGYSQ